jgi:hypothetical protein
LTFSIPDRVGGKEEAGGTDGTDSH